jgi:hypothetical protein
MNSITNTGLNIGSDASANSSTLALLGAAARDLVAAAIRLRMATAA